MQTHTGLAATGGAQLLGTERLSATPALAPGEASGQSFVREFERALERSRGTALVAERRAERAGEQRAARHEGFGRPEESADASEGPESDVWAADAVFRLADGPARPSPAAVSGAGAPAVAPERGSDPQPPGGGGQTTAQAPLAPSTPLATAASAATAAAALVPPARAGAVLAASATTAREPRTLATPALDRTNGRSSGAAQPASAPPADGPDPAILERAHEILRQIRLHAAPGMRRITLALEPVELGRLSVQLALRAGKVAAIVRGEDRATLELLQRHENDLLQVFAERGIATDSVRYELGFGTRRAGGEARERKPAADALPARAAPSHAHAPRPGAPRVDTLA